MLVLALVVSVVAGGVAQAQGRSGAELPAYEEPSTVPPAVDAWPASPVAQESSPEPGADDDEPVVRMPPEPATVAVARGGGAVQAGSLVSLALPSSSAAERVSAQVAGLDAAAADGVSPFGVAFRVDADGGGVLPDGLTVGVDLAELGVAAGGELARRLQVTQLTGCASASDSGVDGVVCSGLTPLASQVDAASGELRAVVDAAAPVEVRTVASDPALADADPASLSAAEAGDASGTGGGTVDADASGAVDPAGDPSEVASEPVEAVSETAAQATASEPAESPSEFAEATAPGDSTEPAVSDESSGGGGLVPATESLSSEPSLSLATASTSGFTVMAVTSGASSSAGSYAASPATLVSDDQVGLFTGAAELGYDIPVPAAAAGPAPSLALSYSSAAVDGMSASTNNQPGGVGVGWDLGLGSVQRIFKPCSNGRDTCGTGDQYTLSLNGVSSRLVSAGGSSFLLASDPRWKITRKVAPESNHPDEKRYYFQVTTPDGTKYLFGREFEAETGARQSSAQKLKLRSPSEYCASAGTDRCDAVWRWDLDRIEDPNGNVVSYFHAREHNEYKPYGSGSAQRYVRASRPVRIEYTKRAGVTGGSTPNARVLLNWESRCGNENRHGNCTWPNGFEDTPGDLWCRDDADCSSSTNPQTFFSQMRLGAVLTQVRDGGSWDTQAVYDLAQTFPDYAESGTTPVYEEPKLALYRVHRRPGGDYQHFAFSQLEAEASNSRSGVSVSGNDYFDLGSGQHVKDWSGGDWIRYGRVWFGDGSPAANKLVAWQAANAAGGKLQVWIDAPSAGEGGTKIAEHDIVNSSGEWKARLIDVTATVSGTHDVYVKTSGSVKGGYKLSWVAFRSSSMSNLPSVRWTDFAASDTTSGFNDDFVWKANRSDTGGGVSHMYLPRVKLVRNELGGETRFHYQQTAGCASGNWHTNNTHCYPEQVEYDDETGIAIFRKYVVSKVERRPVYGGSPDEVYTYAYANPAWRLTNRPDRTTEFRSDFRGHGQVTVTDVNGDFVVHRFFQGMDNDPDLSGNPRTFTKSMQSANGTFADSYWLAGREYETRVKSANGSRFYDTRRYFHTDRNAGPSSSPDSDYAAWFVAEDVVTDVSYTGTDVETKTRYEYDDYGNVVTTYEDGRTGDTSDNRVVATAYAVNTGKWIVDTPRSERLFDGTTTSAPVVGKTLWHYDGNASYTDPPTKGNLTEERAYHAASGYATTSYTNDAWGRPTVERVANPGGTDTVATTTYDALHGYVTAERVHASGTTATSGDDHVTTTAFDDLARPVTVTDVNGNATTLTYDGYGRLKTVTEPGHGPDATAKFSYSSGLPARTTSEQRINTTTASGQGQYVAGYAWVDGLGRQFQSQAPMQASGKRSVTSTRYDALGRVEYESDPYELSGDPNTGGANGEAVPDWSTVWRYTRNYYDPAGRVTTVEDRHKSTVKATTTSSYDGFETKVTNPRGNRLDTTTDAFDNITQVQEHNGATVYATTAYAYDAADRLTTVTDDAGNTTTVSYDWAGRKTAMTDPDSGTWAYAYNDRGDLTSQTDGNNTQLHFAYDAFARQTTKRTGSASGPVVATWTYDAAGHKGLLAATTADYGTDGTVDTAIPDYDPQGRPLRVVTKIPTGAAAHDTYAQQWTYTPTGDVATMTYPGGPNGGLGETVTYTYDTRAGLAETLAGTDTYVTAADYTGFGALARIEHGAAGNDLTRDFGYGHQNRLSAITATATGAGTIVDSSIGYDPLGNVVKTTDWTNSNQAVCHDYDHLDRLTRAYTRDGTGTCDGTADLTVGSGGFDRTYTYDTIGNLTANSGTGTLTYAGTGGAGPHAVTGITDSGGGSIGSFSYDQAGNMTARQIASQVQQTLTYDHDNRLTQVTQGADATRFFYDADGARVARTDPTATTHYVGGVYERDTTTGTATLWYSFAGDSVAFRDGGTLKFTVGDYQGSTSTVYTPATGDIARQRYYPYGDLRDQVGTVGTDIGYTGQRRDDATGLMYYQSRYYDPHTARFAQPDTIVPDPANAQDLNRYTYVRNNPTSFTDPTGHILWEGGSGSTRGKVKTTRGGTRYVSYKRPAPRRVSTRVPGGRTPAKKRAVRRRAPRRHFPVLRAKTTYSKRRAPKLGIGSISVRTSIVNKYAGIEPDGPDASRFRFSFTWNTDVGEVYFATQQSCRTVPSRDCEAPYPVRPSGNVSLAGGSSYSFGEVTSSRATMTFNFRAHGVIGIPGRWPGGISGQMTASKDGRYGRLEGEHDQFPTWNISVNGRPAHHHAETGLTLGPVPLGLNPLARDVQFSHAWPTD